jgi:competence protein ComEC
VRGDIISNNRLMVLSVMACFLLAVLPAVFSSSAQAAPPGLGSIFITDLKIKGSLPQEEWVKVTNTGTSKVNMKGWKIVEAGHKYTYVFPSYVLKARSSIILYTGKGISTANTLYWGRSTGVWTDSGDKAILYCYCGARASTMTK